MRTSSGRLALAALATIAAISAANAGPMILSSGNGFMHPVRAMSAGVRPNMSRFDAMRSARFDAVRSERFDSFHPGRFDRERRRFPLGFPTGFLPYSAPQDEPTDAPIAVGPTGDYFNITITFPSPYPVIPAPPMVAANSGPKVIWIGPRPKSTSKDPIVVYGQMP
jgi:hypothetical protein